MKITGLDVLRCDAGWRNYAFVKVTTDEGVTGWSEYDDAYGAAGIGNMILHCRPFVIGASALDHELVHRRLMAANRPTPGGAVTEAIGAIENALLDVKARALGVPCWQLLGGRMRDRIPTYWSHFGTWEVAFAEHYGTEISSLDDLKEQAERAARAGVKAIKTNIIRFGEDGPRVHQPGFGAPFSAELNVDRAMINDLVTLLEALRDGGGAGLEILLDLNFNARTEGFLTLVRALNDLDLHWVELDTFDADALRLIRDMSVSPIASCETLCGLREFRPFLEARAMDVAVIDAIWNGVWQSMKIASLADSYEVNIAPHNFYGHLATMMNVHFAAAVPNLRIMENDPVRLKLDETLFDHAPEMDGQSIVVPDRPGWGVTPDEDVIAAHTPRDIAGMF